MKPVSPPHYRTLLEREYQSRLRRNPSYSLRAFARDIGMQPSKLSEVLRGLRGVSPKTAQIVAARLKLPEKEAEGFLNLVDFHQTKNKLRQISAAEKLVGTVEDYDQLNLERFKIIADWHHFAILELTETTHFESDPRWIAGRLGVSTKTATEAIERLLDFGLLKKDKRGILKQTNLNLATPSGIPSREIREHHSQILMKADHALQETPLEERDFSAVTVAFNSEDMAEIRNELKSLRRRMVDRIQSGSKKDRVYCFSMQFFPLDKLK